MGFGIELVTNDVNGTVCMWKRTNETFECVKQVNEEKDCYWNSVRAAPNRPYIVTAHRILAKLWNTETCKCVLIINNLDLLFCVALSDEYVATGYDEVVKLFDYIGNEVATFRAKSLLNCISFSPDGKKIAYCDCDGFVPIWNIAAKEKLFTLEHQRREPVCGISWSPDGRNIITSCHGDCFIWNDGTMIGVLQCNIKLVTNILYSPDGAFIATAGDGIIFIWDNETKVQLFSLRGHKEVIDGTSNITGLSFTSDSKLLASSCNDGTSRIWDVESRKCIQVINHNVSLVHVSGKGVAFIPIDQQAVEKRHEVMFAVSMIMEKMPDELYIPPEIWYPCLKHTYWRDWKSLSDDQT